MIFINTLEKMVNFLHAALGLCKLPFLCRRLFLHFCLFAFRHGSPKPFLTVGNAVDRQPSMRGYALLPNKGADEVRRADLFAF